MIGALGLVLVAGLLFITEHFFLSMFAFSIALLLYTTGTDIVKIAVAVMTAMFSTKHLTEEAALIGETSALFKDALLPRDEDDAEDESPARSAAEMTINVPSNPLIDELAEAARLKQKDRLEYVAHSYYFDCHEVYEFSRLNLMFTSEAMPYMGLVGTVLGLIMMFDGLGASVNVEALTPQLAIALKTTLYGALFGAGYKVLASRFDQRMHRLDYEYDDLLHSLDLIQKNEMKIEVEVES